MSNDHWRTPQWLFNWLNDLYGPFDIDLAASANNAKCSTFFTWNDNAFDKPWHAFYSHSLDRHVFNGFCNPPYSYLPPWLAKAKAESEKGFKSTWVLPCFNGEQHWQENVFEKAAAEVTLIFGRVAFLDQDGTPIKANRGGTMIVHYGGGPNLATLGISRMEQGRFTDILAPIIRYENRDVLIKKYA